VLVVDHSASSSTMTTTTTTTATTNGFKLVFPSAFGLQPAPPGTAACATSQKSRSASIYTVVYVMTKKEVTITPACIPESHIRCAVVRVGQERRMLGKQEVEWVEVRGQWVEGHATVREGEQKRSSFGE